MAVRRPPFNTTTPIPNDPFYSPESFFLSGTVGPIVVGSGLSVDYSTGVLNSSGGGGGGVTQVLGGVGIGVSPTTGTVTVTNNGVTSLTAGAGIALSGSSGAITISTSGVGTGTVTSVATGTGLAGGPITTTGTISLANTAVTPGSYTYASISVDAQGRLTAASNGTAPVTSVSTGTGLTGGPITTTGTISLANTSVTPGSYSNANIIVDAQGRITSASNGTTGTVTSVSGTAPILSTGGSTPVISLATSPAAGSYTNSSITVDGYGRITAASSGTAPVTSVTGTAPIVSSGGATPAISLANTSVTPGSYTYATITVDAQGRLTAASSGSAPSTTVTSPITNAGTTLDPIIGIQTATTGQLGAVQVGTNIDVTGGVISVASTTGVATSVSNLGLTTITDNVTSTSINSALSANQGKLLQDQINGLLFSGTIELAGTIDASTGLVDSVTSVGTADGYVSGSTLPAADATTVNTYVIVTTPGTMTPPGGSSTAATRGDWFLVSETSPGVYAWTFLNVGFDTPAATTTTAGIVELATAGETQTGTDGTIAVTPLGAAATYIPYCQLTAKGALISASGANTALTLPVGLDGEVLTACAASLTGLCWTPAAVPAIPCACITAKGTIVTGTAPGTPTALAVGTDGYVLTACSADPTGLCWAASSVPAIPCACITGKGALVTGTAANAPVALPPGSDGQILYANAACTSGLTWGTAPLTCLDFDAKGDLLAGFGPDSYGVLPVGANGCVLVACSACGPGLCWGRGVNLATPTCEGIVYGCTNTSNTALGCNAGVALTSGVCNILIGLNAGCALSSGCGNVIIGHNAANQVAVGVGGTIIGWEAGRSLNFTTQANVFLGQWAGCSVDTGFQNTLIGTRAGCTLTSGSNNVAIGWGVNVTDPTGNQQLAIGTQGLTWLRGDNLGNLTPGAGIRDCAGCLGVTGQYLCSTGTGIQWATGIGDTPVGTVNWFAAATAPVGWLVADGRAVSRTGYAALYAVIGTTYGAGDGTSTFNLPDLRGMFLRGVDNAGGTARGCDPARAFGSTQQSAFQCHCHTVEVFNGGAGRPEWLIPDTSTTLGPASYPSSTGGAQQRTGGFSRCVGGAANETRPMNVAMLPCIKYEVTVAPTTPSACGIPCACVTGKGAIIVGSAPNTPTALPVGTNCQILVANSNCAQGLSWANPPGLNYRQCVAGSSTTPVNSLCQVAAISINTLGNPVQLNAYGDAYSSGSNWYGCVFVRRCGSPNVDYRPAWLENSAGNINEAFALSVIDNPPAGTYCYALMMCVPSGSGGNIITGEAGGPVLNAVELGSACYTDAIPCTCIIAKGALIAGAGLNSPTALPVGSNGQLLKPNSACASGLEWSSVGQVNSAIRPNNGTIQLDNLCFRMNGASQNFQIALVSGTATVTWLNSFNGAGGGTVCQDIPLTTSWRALCAGYIFAAHGAIQCATICYGNPVCCAYQFVGIVGCGYNNNVMCVTRIV